jgi:hypothetical protein
MYSCFHLKGNAISSHLNLKHNETGLIQSSVLRTILRTWFDFELTLIPFIDKSSWTWIPSRVQLYYGLELKEGLELKGWSLVVEGLPLKRLVSSWILPFPIPSLYQVIINSCLVWEVMLNLFSNPFTAVCLWIEWSFLWKGGPFYGVSNRGLDRTGDGMGHGEEWRPRQRDKRQEQVEEIITNSTNPWVMF